MRRRYLRNRARGNISYPGLIAAWSAKGKSNDDEDRAILKDLTGNGHDITLNGFAFNTEGSGYGHPEYPDALVFDGVDDYGINEDMPILTDYTVIIKKDFSSGTTISKSKTIGYGAFIMEVREQGKTYSFGSDSSVTINQNTIVYQNKYSYNGEVINAGKMYDDNVLYLGCIRPIIHPSKGAFYSACLFDRSLTEQEIKSFIRKYIDPEYLLPSEIPTPDCYYDFSKGSNDDADRNTIKDYSGNGNNAVAHNFAWSGMSCYGGYGFIGNTGTFIKNNITNWETVIETHLGGKVRFTITGMQSIIDTIGHLHVAKFTDGTHSNIENLTSIKKDGTYELQSDFGFRIRGSGVTLEGTNQITIKEEPLYPGALVFDGADDYVSLDTFNSGFKTVFMLLKNLCLYSTAYSAAFKKKIMGISNDYNVIAYTPTNSGGVTYINGIINTKLKTQNLLFKKHLAINKNESDYAVYPSEKYHPTIGSSYQGAGWGNNKMALYKFLAFKEALTEEQIKAIIKKYNLLDGVNDIEVS